MKLALGTVQFGLDYGVTNTNGVVSINEARKIINYAKKNQIKTLDTAPGYGDSEQVLGRIGIDDCNVVTKTTFLKNNVDEVIDNFYKSLKSLNVASVKGILIHNILDTKNSQFNILFDRLIMLKKEGLVKKIGFSVYTPEDVNYLLEYFDFDLIQLPVNVFDNRLIESRQLYTLKKKGVEIHARSIFLQGLLLNFNKLPSYFSTWKNVFNKYQVMVEKSELSLLEYALNYVLNIQEIDKVLVGVNSEVQLKEIIQSEKKIILNAYPINDINLLNPSLWSDK